jgi:hypothetical protein
VSSLYWAFKKRRVVLLFILRLVILAFSMVKWRKSVLRLKSTAFVSSLKRQYNTLNAVLLLRFNSVSWLNPTCNFSSLRLLLKSNSKSCVSMLDSHSKVLLRLTSKLAILPSPSCKTFNCGAFFISAWVTKVPILRRIIAQKPSSFCISVNKGVVCWFSPKNRTWYSPGYWYKWRIRFPRMVYSGNILLRKPKLFSVILIGSVPSPKSIHSTSPGTTPTKRFTWVLGFSIVQVNETSGIAPRITATL